LTIETQVLEGVTYLNPPGFQNRCFLEATILSLTSHINNKETLRTFTAEVLTNLTAHREMQIREMSDAIGRWNEGVGIEEAQGGLLYQRFRVCAATRHI